MGLLSDTHNCGLRMRRECRERFSRHRIQRKSLATDPDMHHGTCITHAPWCRSRSVTRGRGENVPGIPGACATYNFTYLIRGPLSYFGWLREYLCLTVMNLISYCISDWDLTNWRRPSTLVIWMTLLSSKLCAYSWALLNNITIHLGRSVCLRHGCPDSKVHGAYMGPTWGRQDPGGPRVGLMTFAIWETLTCQFMVTPYGMTIVNIGSWLTQPLPETILTYH